MKATQILYLVLILGIVYWIVTSTHLLDSLSEGFEDVKKSVSEPIIPKGLVPSKLDTEAMPNPSVLGALPFGPYGQMASIGSFQYQDPAMMPAVLTQMKKINEDIRSFLVFEAVGISNSSDPSVQLPLTQLRADSQRLEQEITTLDNNPGLQSQLTQQDLANIEGSLMFLQRKVRLFETSGVITNGNEGFSNYSRKEGWTDTSGTVVTSGDKPKASTADLKDLNIKVHAAILTLSSTGTTDPVVQARIKLLQAMYSDINDMLIRLNKGEWTDKDIPVYKEDITKILPKLVNADQSIVNIFSEKNDTSLSLIEQEIAKLVGTENTQSVFTNLKDKGMFKVSLDFGYNVSGNKDTTTFRRESSLQRDGTMKISSGLNNNSTQQNGNGSANGTYMNLPFDSSTPGMDDNFARTNASSEVSRFDWKKRVTTICEQVKLRGFDPLDFGCIPKGSLTSPAYSWRGHAKMVCGRLGTTMDPDLPIACGCPPQKWKGWTLSL